MATEEEVIKFSKAIEKLVRRKRMPYMDAVIAHCQSIGMELELVPKLLSTAIKANIKTEAENLHFLERSKTKKLPIKYDTGEE